MEKFAGQNLPTYGGCLPTTRGDSKRAIRPFEDGFDGNGWAIYDGFRPGQPFLRFERFPGQGKNTLTVGFPVLAGIHHATEAASGIYLEVLSKGIPANLGAGRALGDEGAAGQVVDVVKLGAVKAH